MKLITTHFIKVLLRWPRLAFRHSHSISVLLFSLSFTIFIFYIVLFMVCGMWKSGFLPQTVFHLEQLQVMPSDKTTKIITWKSLCNRCGLTEEKSFQVIKDDAFLMICHHEKTKWSLLEKSTLLLCISVWLGFSSVDVELGVVFLFLFSAVICRTRSYAWPCYPTKTNSSP